MRSKGNAPTAEQKRFVGWVSNYGCCVCHHESVEIHHVVGSSARSNKIKIGNWFVLPLCYRCHRDPRNEKNVTNWKKRFESEFGTQKELFREMIIRYSLEKAGMPFSQETFDAIMSH